MSKVRVRFAPSPTGALHIGGIRTALYNYLFAKKQGGTFILRIEDTDQGRYVPRAEAYIQEALEWCGLPPDEGPGVEGEKGPYRQSERKHLYGQYAQQLVDNGMAYYAFDTQEELQAARAKSADHSFKYDHRTRLKMRNSLNMPEEKVRTLIEEGYPYTIRLKVPVGEQIRFQDIVREEVTFDSDELDDKVLIKADGMPTYHMANIIDDHLMEITHVIRGEEWLSSTAHHVLLYQFLGWEASMPQFAHLPLILKPNGKGKLSKRDGRKLGMPVFPLSWEAETEEDSFDGFREFGFNPEAVVNFLAFLGWNPGTEQELFSLEELIEAFSLDQVSKSAARFDYDKALWYNQQYLIDRMSNESLAAAVRPFLEGKGVDPEPAFLAQFVELYRERVHLYTEFYEQGYYFFEPVREYDQKMLRKKWKSDTRENLQPLLEDLENLAHFNAEEVESCVKQYMDRTGLGFGKVLPFLRLGLSGTTKGPGVFEMMALMGKATVVERLDQAWQHFDEMAEQKA